MTTRFRFPQTPTAALLLLALAGCAGGGPGQSDPYDRAGRANEIRLEVLNHNFSDATLYLWVRDARRSLIGQVTGKTTAEFTLPWTYTDPVRIEINMIAGPRCVTRAMDVDPGDELQLEIRSVFNETAFCERF